MGETCETVSAWILEEANPLLLHNATESLLTIQPVLSGSTVYPISLPAGDTVNIPAHLMEGSGSSPACTATANLKVWSHGEGATPHLLFQARPSPDGNSTHVSHVANSTFQTEYERTTNTVTFSATGSTLSIPYIILIGVVCLLFPITFFYVRHHVRHNRRRQAVAESKLELGSARHVRERARVM